MDSLFKFYHNVINAKTLYKKYSGCSPDYIFVESDLYDHLVETIEAGKLLIHSCIMSGNEIDWEKILGLKMKKLPQRGYRYYLAEEFLFPADDMQKDTPNH